MRRIWKSHRQAHGRALSRIALASSALVAVACWAGLSTGPTITSGAGASTVSSSPYGAGHLMAADPNGGYWTTTWLGAISSYGGAPQFGSPAGSGLKLTKPIVGMEPTPSGSGYWLV